MNTAPTFDVAYLVLSGTARFVVEFWRVNPKIYLGDHFSNAQMAALGSVLVGGLILTLVRHKVPVGGPAPMPERLEESPA